MDVGVISDVHGNVVALRAVLEDMPAVDALACAGDVVGYNPWPAECLAAIRSPGAALADVEWPVDDRAAIPTVMGNHDRAVASGTSFRFNRMAAAGVDHAREALDDDQLAWLADLPDERVAFDGRLKLVHGHPDDPDRYTYPADFGPDLLDDEDVLVMGHTHVQHSERYDEGLALNPGSVGQPRDRDPRAAYAVVDLDEPSAELRRVEYDVERVRAAVREAGLPSKIGERLSQGR